MNLLVDYEGRNIVVPGDPEDTHVVISRRRDGKLRVQATHRVISALTLAQDEGDGERRVASIDGDRAVFTELSPYEPEDEQSLQRSAANSTLRWSIPILLIAIICGLALLL